MIACLLIGATALTVLGVLVEALVGRDEHE